ncbi:tyrosine-type recombinase/integrase [Methylorubrum rhodesianum]|uniref:tyrosine-type recombinase/integrase n=1 Tax=Methylorubrum rhodesianum TaxID=29427 RepID=UPI003D0332FF
MPPERAYLEQHGKGWRVSVNVPAAVREIIGKPKLRHDLGTDSLRTANLLKGPYVAKFKQQIDVALASVGRAKQSETREALELAKWAREARERNAPQAEWDEYHAIIAARTAEIRSRDAEPVVLPADDEDGPSLGWKLRPEAEAEARRFGQVAYGKGTPIADWHDGYVEASQVAHRTKADDERALRLLLQWLNDNRVDPLIERIDTMRAHAFAEDLARLAGVSPATCNKYLSRLSSYWRYLAKRVPAAGVNPWAGVGLRGARPKAGEEERAFTDGEVAKLLSGPAKPHMHDLMMIGALTGARLDAIVDLKVGDTANGTILFQPRKRETHARLVPIHPDLVATIVRRCEGKHADSDLFAEWPPVRKQGSMRERSFKASNHFTDYRREIGVDDMVEGKRRSLVNFHSFRRWFITKLEQAGVEDSLISAIVGHKRGSITLDVYSGGAEIERAAKAIAQIKLPPLDGTPIAEAKALRVRPRKRG